MLKLWCNNVWSVQLSGDACKKRVLCGNICLNLASYPFGPSEPMYVSIYHSCMAEKSASEKILKNIVFYQTIKSIFYFRKCTINVRCTKCVLSICIFQQQMNREVSFATQQEFDWKNDTVSLWIQIPYWKQFQNCLSRILPRVLSDAFLLHNSWSIVLMLCPNCVQYHAIKISVCV